MNISQQRSESDIFGTLISFDAGSHLIFCSSAVAMVIKSRRLRWVRHVEWKGKLRNAYEIIVRKPEAKALSGVLDVDGNMILKWISEK
jgi:hypothetical protein